MENKTKNSNSKILIIILSIFFTLSVGYIFNSFLLNKNTDISKYSNALNNCSGNNASRCISSLATAIGKIKSPKDGLEAVKILIESRRDLKNGCHSLTHDLGNFFYDSFGEQAIVPGHAWCSYGYYHGLMQRYGKNNLDNIVQYAKDLCKKVEGILNDDCLHGIGHAAYTNLLSIPSSLEICNSIEEYDFALTCSDGVIMEEFMNSNNGLLTSGFSVTDCLTYDNQAVQAGCAKAMAQQNVNIGLDLNSSCEIFNKEIATQCSSGYGSSLAGNLASGSSFKITDNQILSCNESDSCAQGFGWISYMYFLDTERAKQLCVANFSNKKTLDTCLLSSKQAKENEDSNR